MKNKHAELIHAWADGATIQTLDSDKWIDVYRPSWGDGITYRIKPEEKKPVVRYLWAFKTDMGNWVTGTFLKSETEIVGMYGDEVVRLDWSRTEFEE